ncbi:MAG TPA: hypothetical protein P5342_06555, partial [Candidatus Cloacimonadota bacterium]|nr:hypothetical protein [Candidatus Cloacimonadota bacterium]
MDLIVIGCKKAERGFPLNAKGFFQLGCRYCLSGINLIDGNIQNLRLRMVGAFINALQAVIVVADL